MNFLAHLYLSCEDEKLLVGNFLGDFLKNKDLKNYDEGIIKGVMLHRHIDVYTDNHKVVLEGVKRLRARHGKYAPVVIDVFYDFILTREWAHFGPKPLAEFSADAYSILQKYSHLLPPKLQNRIENMIADDWLVRYGTIEGIERTMSFLKRRTSQPQYFDNIGDSLREETAQLTEEFHQFFPEIIQEVSQFCNC